ncbi:survival motor neuron protein [Anopheles nili]|uniref:survival motor neuron protein n=1 Tax=Anopheles nili TaxID=185578 RepID=UPI00237A5C15|nr:survival motor neuron protein [Anopheles nili]
METMSTSGRKSLTPNPAADGQMDPVSIPIGNTNGREDIWDDSIIIKKYDASLALIKEEVAKRLAMNTNRKTLAESAGCSTAKSRKDQKKDSESTGGEATVGSLEQEEKGTMEISEQDRPTGAFELNDYVRATYDDGVDYEAKIIGFGDHGDCLIRYVGYNNEQFVLVEELLPSWGRKARRQQRVEAAEVAEAAEGEATAADSQMDISDDERFMRQASKKKINFGTSFGRTNVGAGSGGMSGRAGMMGPNLSTAYMVPPPPPMPPMLESADDVESENLSAMLMSWYMSGYYTGLYHGQRMSQQQQQHTLQQNSATQRSNAQQQKRARQS